MQVTPEGRAAARPWQAFSLPLEFGHFGRRHPGHLYSAPGKA